MITLLKKYYDMLIGFDQPCQGSRNQIPPDINKWIEDAWENHLPYPYGAHSLTRDKLLDAYKNGAEAMYLKPSGEIKQLKEDRHIIHVFKIKSHEYINRNR